MKTCLFNQEHRVKCTRGAKGSRTLRGLQPSSGIRETGKERRRQSQYKVHKVIAVHSKLLRATG